VFFGIIVDTFGELRGKRKDKLVDMSEFCFVCGIDRQTFERHGNGFDIHVSKEHNIWHYLYFIVYLTLKEPTEYTGPEQYLSPKIKEGKIDWFPIGKAMCIDESITNQDIPTQIKTLVTKLDTDNQKLVTISSSIGDLSKANQKLENMTKDLEAYNAQKLETVITTLSKSTQSLQELTRTVQSIVESIETLKPKKI